MTMRHIPWEKIKLGSHVSFRTGKLNSNASKPNGKYPFFTCSQETYKTDTYSFDTECVLLAGNNANGIYPLKYFHGKFDAYQRTYVIRSLNTQVLSNRYLYYALSPKLELMRSISTGAATKFLTLTILKDIEIERPPIEVQERIASILSAYDDLIENNTRRIEILEQMAQTLYREWFVNFRFPGHNKVKLVESEMGPIPERWTVATIDEVAGVNELSIQDDAPEEISYVDIASVSTGTIDAVAKLPFSEAPGRARRVVREGDTIWSTVRPNRRSFALILRSEANLIVSTGFAVLSPRTVPYSYLYFATTTDEFADYLTNHATGSAYPAVNSKDFEAAKILIPPKVLLDKFHDAVEPMLQLRHLLRMRSTTSRATRDFLLPKLIYGEVSVERIETETAVQTV